MAIYLIGDIQGCDAALGQVLAKLDFSPSRDVLYCLGDMLNRGPDSLATARRLMALGGSAPCILGNHDLHFLAVEAGQRPAGRHDTLAAILAAPERAAIVAWLRQQPLMRQIHDGVQDILLVHAGLLPQWNTAQALTLAQEVAERLQAPDYSDWLAQMYGNAPDVWDADLAGAERLRLIVNAATRLRFCTPEGRMDFATKEGAGQAPQGLLPWFDVPGRQSEGEAIAFGHWSTLGHVLRPDLMALDTGCVWGGCLSAMRVDGGRRELLQVNCADMPGALKPF